MNYSFIKKYIEKNNLKPLDVIVAKKRTFGVFNHYLIFLGYDKNDDDYVFTGNFYGKGILLIKSSSLIDNYLKRYKPISIKRYSGSSIDIKKINARIHNYKYKPYNLFFNNCKHFAFNISEIDR